MSERFNLFPETDPYLRGYLNVSDLHTVYYEESGNPEGKPILLMDECFGVGINTISIRFLDPEYYRIILFDKRGVGKSEPRAEIKDNNTMNLIEDIEKIRKHLKIDKWVVFGGSWGAALSLIYAIQFHEHVLGLILRSVWFLGREEINWLYQEGLSMFYPEEWQEYLKPIPVHKRNDIVKAYYEIFTNGEDSEQVEAISAWNIWESNILKLNFLIDSVNSFDDSYDAISAAKLKCHYFVNNMFVKAENSALDNIHKIFGIPAVIINGRYDLACPIYAAWELHKLLPESEFVVVKNTGLPEDDFSMIDELVKVTENFKKLYQLND
ncbi:prolyl aminopeptidase [Sedimentibacter sp.]|uniref:prolyl aminopeptidase n=1 Tax=Sedimentibacter sp. TaxID=1960295 RepID=UPI0028ADB2C2|nr:prolyl aminopeptidase [Sedimentibacter sp.]